MPQALEENLPCIIISHSSSLDRYHGHLHSDPPLLLLQFLVLFSLATIIWAPTTQYTWHIHYGNVQGYDYFIGMKWRAYAGIDFIIRLTGVQILGLPLAMWTGTGYLTSLTHSFLMITSTFLSMMRNQWDRLCKAPSTVPSRQFLSSRHQLPTSCICVHESRTPTSHFPLPDKRPEMLRHHPARKAPFQTQQSITPGLTTLSISAHTHFLISFLLSGLAFIASTCFSLSSEREFMLPSSIHLPATSANSYWGKDLIF